MSAPYGIWYSMLNKVIWHLFQTFKFKVALKCWILDNGSIGPIQIKSSFLHIRNKISNMKYKILYLAHCLNHKLWLISDESSPTIFEFKVVIQLQIKRVFSSTIKTILSISLDFLNKLHFNYLQACKIAKTTIFILDRLVSKYPLLIEWNDRPLLNIKTSVFVSIKMRVIWPEFRSWWIQRTSFSAGWTNLDCNDVIFYLFFDPLLIEINPFYLWITFRNVHFIILYFVTSYHKIGLVLWLGLEW